MKTYVLVTTEVGKEADVQRELSSQPSVTEAKVVVGIYDVVVVLETDDRQQVGQIVIDVILKTDGVLSTIILSGLD